MSGRGKVTKSEIVLLGLTALFLWLTSPVASHLFGRIELQSVPDIEKECQVQKRSSFSSISS